MITRGALPVLVLAGCAGCVPFPQHRYVPEAAGGRLVYSPCPINSHLPAGIEFAVSGVQVAANISRYDGRQYIEIRFDVPAGKVVRLQSGRVEFAWGPGRSKGESLIEKISPVDAPIINVYSADAETQKHMLPIREPMVGGTYEFEGKRPPFLWDRHFWLATYIDPAPAEDVRVTLPSFTVNCVDASLPEIVFRRELFIAIAVINC